MMCSRSGVEVSPTYLRIVHRDGAMPSVSFEAIPPTDHSHPYGKKFDENEGKKRKRRKEEKRRRRGRESSRRSRKKWRGEKD